ncbi:MAG TPA: TlpA disulfide reductase family protein [Steroidobacteraceae bacterium]|nr:TlpA disulfide reductase family protein [Steroidobacteraceae bacterium]
MKSFRGWTLAGRCIAAATLTLLWLGADAQGFALLGRAAPDFALRSFGGTNMRLSEDRGDVVVLTFWGSQCGVCRRQLDILDRSFATYRSAGLHMYGVSVDDDASRAQQFVAAHRPGFVMLEDPAKDVARLYQIDNLPTTVLIDRGGIVRYVYRDFGPRDEALYLSQLRELLNE